MPERTDDPDFAWYRLQPREMAVLAVVGLVFAGLSIWVWVRDSAFIEPEVHHHDTPPARINVNTASAAELTALPGIGEAKANRIVESRKTEPINNLDELAKAAGGIPAKSLERMKPYVVFSDD